MTCPSAATCWTGSAVRARALRRLRLPPGRRSSLLNVSENATYLIEDPDDGPSVLRVHRLGYHTEPRSPPSWPGWTRCGPRPGCARPGCCPAGGDRVVTVVNGGRVTAGLRAVRVPRRDRARPADSLRALRRAWRDHRPDAPACAGLAAARRASPGSTGTTTPLRAGARWGRWQDGVGVGPAELEILGRLDEALRARLAAFGTGPGAVRAGARRHPAGQPAVRRRRGQRHRLRRLRVQLVPVRPRHLGEFLRARAAMSPAWWPLARRATAGSPTCPPRTRPRSGRSSCSAGCCWWPGSARTRAVDIAAELGRRVHAGSCDLAEAYLQTAG